MPRRTSFRFTPRFAFRHLSCLPANEEILDATTGDKEFWIINGAHNLCYLHPAQQGIRSNLNLITSTGHVYSFLLTEISNEPNDRARLEGLRRTQRGIDDQWRIGAATACPCFRRPGLQNCRRCSSRRGGAGRASSRGTGAKGNQSVSRAVRRKASIRLLLRPKGARSPFSVTAIYHDDKFTYIKCTAQEKPTIYEVKDGKPNLINFDLANGVYVIPKIVDQGYLASARRS